jgi:hypothetical protein
VIVIAGGFPKIFVTGDGSDGNCKSSHSTSCCLDEMSVILNTFFHVDHSKSDSRPARRIVLQRLRSVLSEAGNVAIPPLAHKTFDGEGEVLEDALTKSLRIRNEAIKSLCSSVRRFRDATIKEECKRDYPHALQALWKALDRAENLIQN